MKEGDNIKANLGISTESLKMSVVQLDLAYRVVEEGILHDRLEKYDHKK